MWRSAVGDNEKSRESQGHYLSRYSTIDDGKTAERETDKTADDQRLEIVAIIVERVAPPTG